MKFCSFGCGKEAIKQFKNGKYCCSENWQSCSTIKKRFSNSQKEIRKDPDCIFNSEEYKRKISKTITGRKWGPQTEEHKKKSANSRRGKKRRPLTKEHRKKVSISKLGDKNPSKRKEVKEKKRISMKKKWRDPSSKFNSKEFRDKVREQCLGGHAVHMNSCIINPSEGQVETWRITSKICPYVYLNYSITHLENTYSIDIAIPKLEIAIEYDGSYWHQDKKKDLKRQKELEEDGWKFIRYIDKVPTLGQVKEDILKLVEDNK